MRVIKLAKKSKKEEIYEQLKNEIILGDIAPRERIVEQGIAQKYNSSQAPIREALLKLQEDGLVDLIPYTGAFVTEVNYEEIKELFEYRQLIELNALKNGMHLFTKRDLSELEEIINEMKLAGENNELSKLISYDMSFHRIIVEKSRRKISLNIWHKLNLHISRFIATVHPLYFEDLEDVAKTHQPLLNALKQKELNKAKKELTKHLDIEPILQKVSGLK